MRVTILSKLKKMAIDNLCMWANFIYMTKTNGSVVVAQGPCLFLARVNRSKNPSNAGNSPVFLSLRDFWSICLVRQASAVSLISNGKDP